MMHIVKCFLTFYLCCLFTDLVHGEDTKNATTPEPAEKVILWPTNNPQITCNATGVCGDKPCEYEATAGDFKSRKDTEVSISCQNINHVSHLTPKDQGEYEVNITCYEYKASNHSFTAAEVRLTFPPQAPNATMSCDQLPNCMIFNRSNTEVEYVIGIPPDCYPTPEVQITTTETPSSTTDSSDTSTEPSNKTGGKEKKEGAGSGAGSREPTAFFSLIAAVIVAFYSNLSLQD